MDFCVTPSAVGQATITVPGDKSISHRALMLGSIAEGESRITGFLAGADCLATLAAFRAMGVAIEQDGETTITVHGVGLHGLTAPARVLDVGNSGTAMRLMAGLLAGQAFSSELTGDLSLSRRPMGRIVAPLTRMGAVIESDCDGTPPLQIRGGVKLRGIDYTLPVASAQVKSCILLAGLYASGTTSVVEPAVTRDHTERMLRSMGVPVDSTGNRITLEGGRAPKAAAIDVPADLSSATFPMLAALLSTDADIVIERVGINPTRTGVIDILLAMGASIELSNKRMHGDEPVADIRVRSSRLDGIDVDPALVSLAIDEFPALFVAAAAARGVTRFTGLAELRVKESDRIAAMAAGLRGLGIEVEESDDGALVHGGRVSGGDVDSRGDHRIAMALATAGVAAGERIRVKNVDNVATSFPGFPELMRSIGLDIITGAAA